MASSQEYQQLLPLLHQEGVQWEHHLCQGGGGHMKQLEYEENTHDKKSLDLTKLLFIVLFIFWTDIKSSIILKKLFVYDLIVM